MEEFACSFHAQDVVFGAGSVSRLGELAERFGWQRLMLCVSERARARGQVAPVERALGDWLVATYECVQPHVQEDRVAEALSLAMDCQIDAVIGLGGGSAIGTAKAVSFAFEEQRAEPSSNAPQREGEPLVAIVAIPTTYAGSEMTPVYGVTHQTDGVTRKVTVSDPKLAPRLVVYDPLLTFDLPPRLTAGTGVNAIAHCIEALYSITRNPLSTAAARESLRLISRSLLPAYAQGHDAPARAQMMTASFLAGTALANVAMGLHHGVCHVLGGTAGVAHGDANAIILPHAMRFNLTGCAPALALAAEAMGCATTGETALTAAEAAIEQVSAWIERMDLPRRLRDAGVREEQLPQLAQIAFASRTVRNNPTPVTDAAQIEQLLRDAW